MRRLVPVALALTLGFTVGYVLNPPRAVPVGMDFDSFEILQPTDDFPGSEHKGVQLHRFNVYRVNAGGIRGTIEHPPLDGPRPWIVTLKTGSGSVAVYGTPTPD